MNKFKFRIQIFKDITIEATDLACATLEAEAQAKAFAGTDAYFVNTGKDLAKQKKEKPHAK